MRRRGLARRFFSSAAGPRNVFLFASPASRCSAGKATRRPLAADRPDRRRGVSSPRAGFTLVGVVVAMAIIVILVAAVGPSVAMMLERDRETELIFRGKQYARAIMAFQKRYGRFPNELKEMSAMKPRTIRKLWKDPMCNCDDWQVIFAGSPEAAPMGNAPPTTNNGLTTQTPGRPTRTPSDSFGGGFGSETPTPGAGGWGSGSGPNTTPTPSSIFGQQGKKVGPIVGVRTKVHRKAVVPWRGRNNTDEWRFIAGDADNDQPTAVGPNPGVLTPAAPSR